MGGEWIVFRNWSSANPKTDVITFYLSDGLITGWKNAFVPSPTNEGSIYEYKPSENIKEWFFPDGKSRWDGTNMSVQEWNMLTDTQKVMFFTECTKELAKESGSHAALDTSKYILALNHYADTCSTTNISITIADEIKKLIEANEAKPGSGSDSEKAATAHPENPISGITPGNK